MKVSNKAALFFLISLNIILKFTETTSIANLPAKIKAKKFLKAEPMKESKTTLNKPGNNVYSSWLSFLYESRIGSYARKVLTQSWVSNLAGYYCGTRLSRRHIQGFAEKYGIDLSEAENEHFSSFNDFFTRKLKPESRPIDDTQNVVTSPADGTLLVVENLNNKTRFPIKGVTFNLKQFLQNQKLSEDFQGGTLLIFRLSPWDYHRFHFPCDCTPGHPEFINGRLESVNPLVYRYGIQPLTENERHLSLLKTDKTDIAMVNVGAILVGKITETYTPNKQYKKGDEAGYFSFGGSTTVLVFKKNEIILCPEFIENSKSGVETPVKMGQKIGNFR